MITAYLQDELLYFSVKFCTVLMRKKVYKRDVSKSERAAAQIWYSLLKPDQISRVNLAVWNLILIVNTLY